MTAAAGHPTGRTHARRRRWLVGGFAAALALFAASGVLLLRQDRASVAAGAQVEHTLRVLQQTLELDAEILLMENQHRAWLVRGTPGFLAERDRHHQAARAALADLQQRTRDDPRQQARLARVDELIAQRDARMRRTVSLADEEGGLDAARAFFRGEGEGSLEPLHAALAEIATAERARLTARRLDAAARAAWLRWLILAMPAAGLLVLLVAFRALLAQLDEGTRLHVDLAAAEAEQRTLNQALQASVKELESFSYSVSHDLRAPLRHIDGYARMLAEDLGPDLADEPRRFLEQIGASSRRMGALIDDLLSLSRLGRKPLAVVNVDMTQLAADAWREVAQDSRASARFILEPLPAIAGDPALLRQVWLNLLSNALKYSAPRGDEAIVEVSASRAPESVTYHVRDNGVGFDPRYADKLFGVFQRLHAQDEFEGTGVGLAIVHRIVSRHGGNVWAESDAGLGACFSFELPGRDDDDE